MQLANQNARTVRGGVVICWKANMTLDKSNSFWDSFLILIGQLNQKLSESSQNDVTN